MQHLGTMPRQPGVGEVLGDIVREGAGNFMAARQAREIQDVAKEELGLKQKQLKLQESELELKTKESMRDGLLKVHQSLTQAISEAAASGQSLPDMERQLAQVSLVLDKEFGIPADALNAPLQIELEKERRMTEDLFRQHQVDAVGGENAIWQRGIRLGLEKFGTDLESRKKVMQSAFEDLGGANLPTVEARIQMRKKILDRINLEVRGMEQERTPEFARSAEAGRAFMKGAGEVAETVKGAWENPLVRAGARTFGGVPVWAAENLPEVAKRMKGMDLKIKGFISGASGE